VSQKSSNNEERGGSLMTGQKWCIDP